MELDLTETLSELIAIPSVNPMGRDVEGDEYFEYRVTDYLENLFERMGVAWQRQAVAPKRDNILARLDGHTPPEQGGAVLLFEAHQDTVPVEGMTIEPWTPTIKDGRIYGRGSCDIKGGMVAMLGALARLADNRPPEMPTIIMACTVNEEHGYTGATALTKLWTAPGNSIMPRRPDAAVVTEPTGLDIVVAHKGAVRWRCHTHGRATHSSQPHLGENAIYKMAKVLAAFERYATEHTATLARHPLCGVPTLSVGTIHGGISVNTVPDRCTIEIDRRILPGENGPEVYQQIIDYVTRHAGAAGVEHEKAYMMGSTLADTHNGPLADRLATVAQELLGRGKKVGVPYGTDASTISGAGVPSIVFGPGSIDQAHTADEWLPLDELKQASDALYEFARRGL
ncbi:MAG TPA: M20 family metallopeptidase [Pirellulales bacterium]|jgi:acetylornithine deacetylase|nr:M20 family metallopeptidase [Pirellulales bacterium]